MYTISIIHTQCGPYHCARAEALASIYHGSVDLIQLASQELSREWLVEHRSITATTIGNGVLESLPIRDLKQCLIKYLQDNKPTVLVVAGYSHPVMRSAIKWANYNRIPVILLSDSQSCDRTRNPLLEMIKGHWIQRHCDAAFVAGASAAKYLGRLGFPKHMIWRGYDVVDNQYFSDKSNLARQFQKTEQARLGLPDNYFLYVGRFAEEKNLIRLLKAFKLYQSQRLSTPFSLVLIGSGAQEHILKLWVKENKLDHVIWPGFQQINQLPVYYGLASALVLPSISEPWGLVVNEAMACGLPVLASERCGCVWELIFPGINGYVFDPFNVENIAEALVHFTSLSEIERVEMGKRSQKIVANFSTETWALSLVNCAKTLQNKLDV